MQTKYKKPKANYWGSIALLAIGYLVIQIGIYGIQELKSRITVAFASENIVASTNIRNNKLQADNKTLEITAKVATAESKPVTLTDNQVKQILSIVIPDPQAQNRLFNIITKCENHSHNPIAVNANKDKSGKVWSYDLGVAQINSYYHAAQVQALFGEDFDSAMKDPAKNLMFAAWMWQHDKNFNAWACNKIVK